MPISSLPGVETATHRNNLWLKEITDRKSSSLKQDWGFSLVVKGEERGLLKGFILLEVSH